MIKKIMVENIFIINLILITNNDDDKGFLEVIKIGALLFKY